MPFNNLLILDALQNPAIVAAIFAIIRNIGGWAYACFEAHKVVPYEASKLLETLVLYETFFIALSALPSFPADYQWTVALAVEVIRNLRNVAKSSGSLIIPTEAASTPPATPVVTYGPWLKVEDATGKPLYARSVMYDGKHDHYEWTYTLPG